MAESEEELKGLLMKEKEERGKAGSLSKLLEMVKDREAWLAAVH